MKDKNENDSPIEITVGGISLGLLKKPKEQDLDVRIIRGCEIFQALTPEEAESLKELLRMGQELAIAQAIERALTKE